MNKTTVFEVLLSELTVSGGVLTLATGVLTGLFYFICLYWTIHQLPKVQKRGVFLFLSTLVRLAVFFGILVLVADKNALKMLIFFVGFLLTRFIVLHYKKRKLKQEDMADEQ